MKKKIIFITLCLFAALNSCPIYSQSAPDIDATASFGRAFGIARYYSPNPYTEKWSERDWYIVCFYLTKKFDAGRSENDIQTLLKNVFSTLAPNAAFSSLPGEATYAIDDPERYFYWEHTGAGFVEIPKLAKLLSREYRNYKPFYKTLVSCDAGSENAPVAGKIYSYRVGDNVCINIPIAEKKSEFSKSQTDKLLSDAKKEWKQYVKKSGASFGEKLMVICLDDLFWTADMIFRWNVIQHFYPYHEEDSLDWYPYLDEMLAATRKHKYDAPSRRAVYDRYETIGEVMNPVHDSHISLFPDINLQKKFVGRYIPHWYLPVTLKYIDGHVIVSDNAPNSGTEIAKGSVVTSINGVGADELLDKMIRRRNWSTIEYGRSRGIADMVSSMTRDSLFTLGYVTPDGESMTDTLRTTLNDYYYAYSRKGEFMRNLGEDIYFVDPKVESATYANFKAGLGLLQSARGVIFDLRGYPSYEFEQMLGHLTDKPLPVTTMLLTPVSCFPNREKVVYKQEEDAVAPLLPRIDAPVVFLCDASAISWAETVLMLVKGHGLGTIIGSHSCGTTGDVTTYYLPAFGFRFTAIKAVNVDGSQHHGIGVIPDIEAKPTLEGYRSGKDEVLEAAIKYLSDK